jgi:ADP-ribosyltransferase exoenzyme
VVDNWAKWDAEHGRGADDGKERSADKLAKMIKGTVGNHEGTRATVSSHGSGGSVVHKSTKKASKPEAPYAKASREADEATKRAEANPTEDNHKAAMQSHSKAFDALTADKKTMKANESAISYHNAMRTYHYYANDPAHPDPGVLEEHNAPGTGKVDHDAATSEFMGPEHRAAANSTYKSVAEVRKTGATPEELDSVNAYTRGSDSLINKTLRQGPHSDPRFTAEANQHISNLDSVFARQSGLKDGITTFRGVHKADQLFGPVGGKVGQHFVDDGFSSTSVHPDVAATFGSRSQGGALLRIHTAAGTKVLNPAGAGGFGRAEKEILMPRGSSYHIKADRMVRLKNGMMQRQIDLEHKGSE